MSVINAINSKVEVTMITRERHIRRVKQVVSWIDERYRDSWKSQRLRSPVKHAKKYATAINVFHRVVKQCI